MSKQHDQAADDLPANLAARHDALAAAGYATGAAPPRSARPSFSGCTGWDPRRSTSSLCPRPPAAAIRRRRSARGTVAEAACLEVEICAEDRCCAPFVSLDGVVELSEQWTIPYFTADMQRVIQQGMARGGHDADGTANLRADGCLLAEPDRHRGPFAEFLNTSPKLVVSTTLQSVDWQNST